MKAGRMLAYYIFSSVLPPARKLVSLFLFVLLGILSLSTFSFAQTTITYTYDNGVNGIGRLSSVTDPTGSTTYSYDVRGNVTQTVKVIEGNSFTSQSTYDSLNRITTLTYPDNEVVSYTYDPAGNLKTVTGQPVSGPATSYVTNITYNSFGQRATMNMGSGNAATTTTYTYDSNHFRLNQIYTTGGPGSTVFQDLNYCYDYAGNVTKVRGDSNCADTTTGEVFGYDHLNRLTTANGNGLYGSLTYVYNEIGNMMTNPRYGNQSATYTYPSSGSGSVRPHAVTTVQQGSTTYTYDYDANGNMFLGPNRSITYDMENRPTTVVSGSQTVTMAYDFKGDRVKKVVGSSITYYLGVTYEKKGATTTKYVFAGSTRVAMKTSDGDLLYYHRNHLGSTHVVTDGSGAIAEQIQYNPFGSTFSDTGPKNVNHKYTSQELDSDTGLYYYRARYYDAVLARFISADTIGVKVSKSQTLNRYSYVLNNPLRYIDPSGHNNASFSWNNYAGNGQVYGTGCISQCPGSATSSNIGYSFGWQFGSSSTTYNFNGQGTTVIACHPSCSGIVPKTPPGTNIDKNILETGEFWNTWSPSWYVNQLRNSGEWNYKKQGSEYEDFGNFNYGATSQAMFGGMGIPDQLVLRGAGAYGMCCGTYDRAWGTPLGGPPYGDDPHDQEMIRRGMQYYHDHIDESGSFMGGNPSGISANDFSLTPWTPPGSSVDLVNSWENDSSIGSTLSNFENHSDTGGAMDLEGLFY